MGAYLNKILATIGMATIVLIGIAFVKLVVALKARTNIAAALARPPSRAAFANKVFWITGASSGIGRALALHLCTHHDDVRLVLSSRRADVLQQVAAECRGKGNGAKITVLPVDLAEHSALKSKAEKVLASYDRRVDVLVNNGGVSTRSMARNANFDVDTFVTNVDFLSYVALTKALLPAWESQGSTDVGPIIINMSSIVGRFGGPVRTAYSGAKHAIMGWFDAFRVEQILAGHPIHVLNVVLGSTRTNVARNAITVSPGEIYGESDSNIQSGLDPEFVVERILVAAYAGQGELWIAPRKELLLLYLNQYVPELARKLLTKAVAKQYAVEKSDGPVEGIDPLKERKDKEL